MRSQTGSIHNNVDPILMEDLLHGRMFYRTAYLHVRILTYLFLFLNSRIYPHIKYFLRDFFNSCLLREKGAGGGGPRVVQYNVNRQLKGRSIASTEYFGFSDTFGVYRRIMLGCAMINIINYVCKMQIPQIFTCAWIYIQVVFSLKTS
jgi:hypothetical protein